MLGIAPSDAVTSVSTADIWPHCSVGAVASTVTGAAAMRLRSHSSIVSPKRCRNVAPWLCPWSETMTMRYGRGQSATSRSSRPSARSMPSSAWIDSIRSGPEWWAISS
jgi:hypothetical protein